MGLNFIKSWCWCIMMTLPSQNINTWKRLVKIKWEFNGLLNIVKTSFLYFQATCFNMKYIKTEKKTVFLNWSLIVNCKTVNTECLIQLHYNLVTFFVYIWCCSNDLFTFDYCFDWLCTYKHLTWKGEKKRLINNIQSEADPNHPHSHKIREILFTLSFLSPISGGKD